MRIGELANLCGLERRIGVFTADGEARSLAHAIKLWVMIGRVLHLLHQRRQLLLASVAVLFLFEIAGAQDATGRFMKLRGDIVSPAYEGWWPNEDGSFTLFFG